MPILPLSFAARARVAALSAAVKRAQQDEAVYLDALLDQGGIVGTVTGLRVVDAGLEVTLAPIPEVDTP